MQIQYAPIRVACQRFDSRRVGLRYWAEPQPAADDAVPQQHAALDAALDAVIHVATKHGLSWHSVQCCECSCTVI